MKLHEATGPLRHQRFRLLFAAHALSRFGTELALVSVAFAVLRIDPSAGALGWVLAARTVPALALLAFGGVWADRWPRRRLMVGSDIVSAVVQATFAVLLIAGGSALWPAMVLQALLGAATAFFWPAASAVTPSTVPESELQRANALLGLVGNTGGLLGPALAGLLVATAGPGWSLAVDAATFAVSAVLLARLPAVAAARDTKRKVRFAHDLAEGWREVRRRRWLAAGLLQGLVFQATFAVFFVLGPLTARNGLGGAAAWGLIVTGFGAGSLLGGLVALRLHPRRPLLGMQAALLVSAPALATLAWWPWVPAVVVAAALAGAGFAAADAYWETTVHQQVPDDRLSRVAAFDRLGSACLRPVSYALCSGVAALLGVRTVLTLGSGLMIGAVVVVLVAVPQIFLLTKTARSAPPAPEPAAQEAMVAS